MLPVEILTLYLPIFIVYCILSCLSGICSSVFFSAMFISLINTYLKMNTVIVQADGKALKIEHEETESS